jgi:hypothetical protein
MKPAERVQYRVEATSMKERFMDAPVTQLSVPACGQAVPPKPCMARMHKGDAVDGEQKGGHGVMGFSRHAAEW